MFNQPERGALYRLTVAGLIAVLLLAACDAPAPGPIVSPLNSPAPTSANVAGPLEYPTPQPGRGAVIGRLVSGSQDGPGYVGGDLYLGSLIPGSDPNAQPVVAFTQNVDPKAVVYLPDGRFAFTDITPGEYALVVWNPVASFVIEAPAGGALKVSVRADATTDLGTLVVP